jgi:hypothetical protein
VFINILVRRLLICLTVDVLELDKANEFSVGRQLRVGKYTYSDLDELIVSHIKSMARKVDEMTTHEKFQRGSRADTGSTPRIEYADNVRTMADQLFRSQPTSISLRFLFRSRASRLL